METKFVPGHSFLDKLSEKTLLEWSLKRQTGILAARQNVPLSVGFRSTKKPGYLHGIGPGVASFTAICIMNLKFSVE